MRSVRRSHIMLSPALPVLPCPAGRSRRPHAHSSSAASLSVVEPAAAQIVHKALRFITGDQTPPPPEGAAPPAKVAAAFDSQSFLDKVRQRWRLGGLGC